MQKSRKVERLIVSYLFVFCQACQVCYSCLTEEQRSFIKMAYYEHVNRGGFRRIYPPPVVGNPPIPPLLINNVDPSLLFINLDVSFVEQNQAEARKKMPNQNLSPSNYLMEEWLRQKCLYDPSWCQ